MMNRRALLKLLGVSGAYAGLAASDLSRLLHATSETGAARRLIVISHCHGWPYDSWKMRPGGQSHDEAWEADLAGMSSDEFSAPLAPLYEHRNKMLILDGLSLATAELDLEGNRHDTGWVHSWTGNRPDFSATDTKAFSASLDQIVAGHIARSDRLPSLEISVDDDLESGRPIAYAVNGARLPVENSPARVWTRLFGPSSTDDPLTGRQRGVLDFAHAEYQALAPRLDALQRSKMESHFDLIKGLSDRLEGMANVQCASMPEATTSLPTYEDRFDAVSDLIGAAFGCDLTRVVSLSLGEMPTADFGWDHLTDDVHKGLAHGIYDSADKHQAMTDYLVLHAQQVARLVSVLESIPDTDGGSVMDNTLIIWGSELADGWHGYQHYCPVIIGGSWYFRTGRYIHWPHETPARMLVPANVDPGGYSSASGKPHQHLLVSAAQAMGLGVDHVGMKHFQGQGGDWINSSGPLPDLT